MITLAIGALIRRVDALGKRLAANAVAAAPVEAVSYVEALAASADVVDEELVEEAAPSVETPLPGAARGERGWPLLRQRSRLHHVLGRLDRSHDADRHREICGP